MHHKSFFIKLPSKRGRSGRMKAAQSSTSATAPFKTFFKAVAFVGKETLLLTGLTFTQKFIPVCQ